MSGLIIQKRYLDIKENPLIFLMGPIRGAPLWQDEAIKIITEKDNKIFIASPRREINPAIEPYLLSGEEDYFKRQRAWERHYLDRARKAGAVLCWLPEEAQHDCKKAYGAMTRLEIGQMITHLAYDGSTRFCIGSEGKFSELNTILFDLSLDAPWIKLQPTLEATCFEALRIARS